jgi:hypothetical protein
MSPIDTPGLKSLAPDGDRQSKSAGVYWFPVSRF